MPSKCLLPEYVETIVLLAEGKTSTEIAEQLGMSRSGIRTQIQRIRGAFGLADRAEIVRFAIKEGWIDFDETEPVTLPIARNISGMERMLSCDNPIERFFNQDVDAIASQLAERPAVMMEVARRMSWLEPDTLRAMIQIMTTMLQRRNTLFRANTEGTLARTVLHPEVGVPRKPKGNKS